MEETPASFEIFDDIINDPFHNREIEKNDRFHKVEPNWNPIRDSNDRYYRNKRKMKFICLIMNYGKRMKN